MSAVALMRERIADWVELHEITQGGNMNEETKEITIAIDVEELEQKIAPGELTWPFSGSTGIGGWGR